MCKDVCVLVPMGSDEPFLFVFGNSKHSLYLYMYNALDNNNVCYNGDVSECPSSGALYSSSLRVTFAVVYVSSFPPVPSLLFFIPLQYTETVKYLIAIPCSVARRRYCG